MLVIRNYSRLAVKPIISPRGPS